MRALRWLFVLALVGSAIALSTAWPRVSEVETGASHEYANLAPRAFPQTPAEVSRAVESAVTALPGWSLRGSGSGSGGHAIQAEHRLLSFAPFREDIVVSVRPTGKGSRVSIRSRSRVGPWDLGQNARNIRQLLAELDRRLAPTRGKVGESSS